MTRFFLFWDDKIFLFWDDKIFLFWMTRFFYLGMTDLLLFVLKEHPRLIINGDDKF